MKPTSNTISTPSPHEVWILLDSRLYGGIESHVLELAHGLKDLNIKVRIIFAVKYYPQAPLVSKLNPENLPHSYLNELAQKQNSNGLLSLMKSLRQAVKKYQPQAIHTHGYKAALLARFAKVYCSQFPHLISTYHAGETPKGKVWFYDWLDRLTGRLSEHCFAVSPGIQKKLYATSELINNFVSLPHDQPNLGKEVAFVGRLSHEKGADRFIEIAKEFPTLSFTIYGDGPEREALETDAPINVTFHGHQFNMESVWQQIHFLIITSRHEGLPMVALEAMARGIIVISLDVGRLKDVLITGKNGFIAEDIQTLKEHLILCLTMHPERKLLIQQSAIQTITDHFSAKVIIPKLIEHYQIENPF
ncbi:glycosyl transferase family 1 [Vibrio azureus]|uniref:Glycosyltransferase n=1 Tax=Vibrio azureus NBRC 104587 TaxID=1219077 RepID=U3A2S7_9VIBR|nr:glycosyltransferase family 4 protein [Vibrio azureus]AUI85989.1 glycosyl transferase family 1 [Vibrio azureus]GAD74296.1 hypothetical protein VAZ01S_008_00370 [Vibrio azureus NBRC 104587]